MSGRIKYEQCPGCFSPNIGYALSCEDFTVSKEVFEVWECSNCTLRFTQNVPDAESIGPYYQSTEYISHSDTREGLVNKLYHTVRNYTLKSKRDLIKSITGKDRGNLLDIGAGTGAFAFTMQQAGWQVKGLEPDETARANALNNYDLSLDTLESLHLLPSNTYDAITMWHVLEHVHDLHGYLKTYQRILKDDGKLIIAVPNYTSKDAEQYGEFWAAYDVPRHLYHFSPKSMEVLLESEGFKLHSYKPMWFDSFYVSLLSEQYKTGHQQIGKAFWNGFMSNVKAFRSKDKCSSLIYLVGKK
jgi:SAM-dependent methyltransferase